jgi:hypothetical protein
MHHAMNHVRFMISPELHVVQDGVHGSPEPYMVQGAFRIQSLPYHDPFFRIRDAPLCAPP